MQTRLVASLMVLLMASLSGCTAGSSQEIEIVDNEFEGGNRTVAAGQRFEFDNEGNNLHSVTIHKVGDALTVLKLDKELSHGQSVEYTFSEAGTYHVWCKHHGTMTTGMAIVITVQ